MTLYSAETITCDLYCFILYSFTHKSALRFQKLIYDSTFKGYDNKVDLDHGEAKANFETRACAPALAWAPTARLKSHTKSVHFQKY